MSIEKVFKQHPFLYEIGGNFYILGVGVCRKLDVVSDLTKERYRQFSKKTDKELTQDEAWNIISAVLSEARSIMCKEDGSDLEKGQKINRTFSELKNKLMSYELNEKEMQELDAQIKRYADFWEKYNLSDMPIPL